MHNLVGQNIIVLDVETLKSADDCRHCGFPIISAGDFSAVPNCTVYPEDHKRIGWENKLALGLSIGCYYDYTEGRYHWFDSHDVEDTVRLFVDRKPLLVSFNGIQFDFPLMRAILRHRWESLNPLCDRFKTLCATSYDILAEAWKADPGRKKERGLNSLDAISQANGYGAKEMDGATAPRLWAEGRHAEVLNYCQGDVIKTQRLFEQIIQTGQLLRGDGLPITMPRPSLVHEES